MYETDAKSMPEHAPRAPSGGGTGTPLSDPKFARESFTMRRIQPWQITALAIEAAVVFALAVFYF